MNQDRPTFYYRNNNKLEIKAGGVIFYRYTETMSEPEFLMVNYNGKYEDFGGKTDKCDKNVIDTICREVEEESNNIFSKKFVLNIIKKKKPIYSATSKYIVYVIKINKYIDPINFGNVEEHNGFARSVKWIKISNMLDKDFIKNMLHIRLKFYHFFKKIENIRSQV